MKHFLFSLAFTAVLTLSPHTFAAMPPMPGMTNGDGNVTNNGMKHAKVSKTGTVLAIHIDEPPATPVVMMSGFGVDYSPEKFDVLEDVHFNAQHGWVPDGFIDLSSDESLWMVRTAAAQPAGSSFKAYDGGDMNEGMGAWTMNEIYTANGDRWQWDGFMQHDYYTADMPGNYSMSFEVYVGDSTGAPVPGYSPASTTFEFYVVPEASGLALALLAAGSLAGASPPRKRGHLSPRFSAPAANHLDFMNVIIPRKPPVE